MSLFLANSYRSYLENYLKKLPKKGHGELAKIAKALNVHSTLMSLVLNGDRELTVEQGFDLAKYLELTPVETDYFTCLVQLERAGNHRYKAHILEKLEEIRRKATQLSQRYGHEKTLNDHQKTIFYSSWIFSAVRLFASTSQNGKTFEEIQARFKLSRIKLVSIIDFLLSNELITLKKDRYLMAVKRTFLEHGSPHLTKHHTNWRIKALQQADQITEKELMFTSPISVSHEDFFKLREKLADFLKEFSNVVKDSPADEVACLNIDFFWIEK